MLRDTEWVLVIGGVAAFLNAVTVGANNVAICWGPVLGSKAVTYRTAVVLGGLCQVAGVLAFGPRTYTVYGGFLDTVFDLNMHPELTLYAIMWTVITPVVFQLLAIRCQILVPAYLGTVASTIGAALVFPGFSKVQFGKAVSSPPFLSGVGPIFLTWFCAPMLSAVLVTPSFLTTRSIIFRGEDPFHKALWIMPTFGGFIGVVVAFFVIFVIGPPIGYLPTNRYKVTGQGIALTFAVANIAGLLITCPAVSRYTRKLSSKGRAVKALKRMNLLGLDDATVECLYAQDRSGDSLSCLHRCYTWLFSGDIFAGVAADQKLMRIHTTAEEFDPMAEQIMVPFQGLVSMCLSVAHGANNARTSLGVFTMMLAVHRSDTVTETVPLGFTWRLLFAAGMGLGTLVLGFRLTPVSGVLLAKMTPFRSCIVILNTALAVAILGELQLKGGVTTYAVVAAVTITGFTEGSSHVNWRKLATHLIWWFLGFFCVLLATYALVAQGLYAPSIVTEWSRRFGPQPGPRPDP